MEYKDFIHEKYENGNVRLMAHICVDIEVPKEEYERLLEQRTPGEIGSLVKDWIHAGYIKATSHGDSYFIDKNLDLGDREYFDLGSEKTTDLSKKISNAKVKIEKSADKPMCKQNDKYICK